MSQVLDVIERLLVAAEHPDIVEVERYGPGGGVWGPTVEQSRAKQISGLRVVHRSSATASLWEAVWPGEQPATAPAEASTPRQNRAPRLAQFVAQLLDVAKPEQFTAWRLVTLPGLGTANEQAGMPFGLSIVTTTGPVLLRTTATGPTAGDEPAAEPFPEYVIPDGVRTCLTAAPAGN